MADRKKAKVVKKPHQIMKNAQSAIIVSSCSYKEIQKNGAVTANLTGAATFYNSQSSQGSTNPWFRDRISKVTSATTDFDASRVFHTYRTGIHQRFTRQPGDAPSEYRTQIWKGGYLLFVSNAISDLPNLVADETEARNHALRNFYRNLQATRQSISGPIFLGELRETAKMIRQPALAFRQGLVNYLTASKKMRGLRGKQLSQALGGLWLEYSFGWQPLINDTRDIAKAVARMTANVRTARVTGVGFSDKFASGQKNVYNPDAAVVHRRTEYHAKCIYKIIGGLKAQTPQQLDFKDSFGFNLSNFVPTVWELTPWSFVVDYFTNVGDILEAASADVSDLAWVQETRILYHTYTEYADFLGHLNWAPPAQIWGNTSGPDSITITRSSVRRRASSGSSLGVPTFRFDLPSMNQGFNLAALATQSRATSQALYSRRG